MQMNFFSQFRQIHRTIISRKLFVYFVSCGIFFTFFISSSLIYSEYNDAKSTIRDNLEFIRMGYLQQISSSLYKMDEQHLKRELEGVLKLHSIVHVQVREELGSDLVLSIGNTKAGFSSVEVFPLLHDIGEKTVRIGTLFVTYSMTSVYKELLKQTLIIFFVTALIGFIVLLVFLFFFNKIVVRHILAIADFAVKQDLSSVGPKLNLNRPPRERDELDILVEAFNGMIARIKNDIEKINSVENEVLKSEKKYRSIFDNAVEGIFQTTPEGKILSANPAFARMLGYASPTELINVITDLSTQGYVNPEDRVKFMNMLEEQRTVANFEVQHYRKDGSIIWVLVNARAAKDETGKTLYHEGTIEDITSRKQAEESLKQTLEKLRRSLAGTIRAMSLTVESKDPYTAGHQRRVSNLARAIGQEMNLPDDTIDNIRMAGNVHDIGKISVPAEILAKPTRLSDIEMGLIRVHSQAGYNILKDVELPYPVAEIVLQHHERLNGTGYPQGLKGEGILLEAKILSVADVVEAIATHRPYRPALGIDVALSEIEKNKGILYDGEIVDACIKLFREKGFIFE